MKLSRYIKDKWLSITISIVVYIGIFLLLRVFNSKVELIISLLSFLIALNVMTFFVEFYRKKRFYDSLLEHLEKLDKKYLIQALIQRPNFYEGEICFDSLYDINKSMIEHINNYKNNINEFKEYVEMWIHEIKIPISSLVLINHNNKEGKKYQAQISKLDNYIDQILYYVRSENVEKDFIIKEIAIKEAVKNVALKNKDMILDSDISLEVDVADIKVLTDEKWLEFIINQIVNNSIKYKKETDSFIKISAVDNKDSVLLTIYDNGIGIISSDLSRVFEKSFTGENGRIKTKSTGMGLYIVKKLCDKLGHSISIEAEWSQYTRITIGFDKNDFLKMQ